MARPIETCVHCGFCLPDCPTYRELGQEMDSPRGRIILMKEVLEGKITADEAAPYIDRCLGCLACETSCPSGVHYRDLISPYRAHTEEMRSRPLGVKFRRWLLSSTLPFPHRFYLAAKSAQLARPFSRFLPKSARAMLDLLPSEIHAPEKWPAVIPAQGGSPKARVALLLGCAQRVLAPEINRATISLLTRHGIEVHIPQNQSCCGALAWHTGDAPRAKSFARQNLSAFPKDVDHIITNAAGCGSGLQEYPLMLSGEYDEERATAFSSKVIDFTVLLDKIGFQPPPALAKPLRVAYHDACHLAHAQGVRKQPRALLRAITGLELVELPDSNICCGSAGSYNIDQPKIAADLGQKKAVLIERAHPDLTVTGNIGCLTQLRSHAQNQQIQHIAVFIDSLY